MLDFFVRKNRFAYLFLITLIGLGSYSLINIPKESSPEVIIPIGVISTTLPGASAADVEALVTNELERGLTSLENVTEITSISSEGVSSVTVEFSTQAPLDDSIRKLKDEVDRIEADLPEDANSPVVSKVNLQDTPILTISLADERSDQEFATLARQLEQELETVAGVTRVEFAGVHSREVTIIVSQEALERFNLSLTEIIDAIRNANRNVPIGQIENNGIAYNLTLESDINNSVEIPHIGIATRAGQPIFVRDVAIVEDGLRPATSLSRLSLAGQPSVSSISFDVYKQAGGDITRITKAVHDRIAELKSPGELLEDVRTATVLDAGKDIGDSLRELSISGLQTAILVVLLLLITIGWREGLLAGLMIPLSFLFGFIGLYFSGNSINFLSLFSLILAIGILVDSAIVMIEGINRRLSEDSTLDKKQAAIATIREFAAPLTSGTLTTVAMFVGLFVVSGVTGQFIKSIPFTIIFLLLASLFVALAILPLLATSFLRRRQQTKLEQKQQAITNQVENWYQKNLATYLSDTRKQNNFMALIAGILIIALFLPLDILAGVLAGLTMYLLTRWRLMYQAAGRLRRPAAWTLVTLLTTLGVGIMSATFLPTNSLVKVVFFDQSDVDFIVVELENPEGTTKEITDIDIRRVEELLYQEDAIESFTVTVGSGSAFGGGGAGEKFASIFINLQPDRSRTSGEIIEDLRLKTNSLADLNLTISQPNSGPPTDADIIIKFLGEDLGQLNTIANQAATLLRTLPDTVNINTNTNNNNTEFVLELDKAKTAALGIAPAQVSQVARTAIFGTEATTLTTLQEDIPVTIKLNINNTDNITSNKNNHTSIDTIKRITIPSPNGPVPLDTLVTVGLRESNSIIEHENNQRVVSITADVAEGGNARETQAAAITAITEQLNIPDGITISTSGGETEESNRAFQEMFLALVIGIGLMVGVLTLQFNSFLHTRYVLSILPYSLIGIMFGLAVTGNALSFPSIMGFIALSGIVVNNSILLIDTMNKLRRHNPTLPIQDIVLRGSSSRLRPIILTTVTTVCGMIPLLYAGDIWVPLAYAVMFGLIFSVLITLLLIPILYFRRPGELGT